tara:strand:+ start:370 stop:678 length:309 start_codon:yes stop_codon:yes gene_type:complete
MSFASNVPKETPQTLWSSLNKKNSRILLTIPFSSKIEEMKGFVSVTGEEGELPLLTICVQNVNKNKCTVTNIVFPDSKTYTEFVDKLFVDSRSFFDVDEEYQ